MTFQLNMSPVSADIGDNIGGGSGGSSGSGSVTDSRYTYALSSPQGYRVTLVTKDGKTLKGPIDIVNSGKDENYARQVKKHFGKINKLTYLSNSPLREKSSGDTYSVLNTDKEPLPDALAFNISAIKSWFTSPPNVKWLCEPDKLNFDYKKLENSAEYKLLIEPLVFINIPINSNATVGSVYAMTATEGTLASVKDRQISYNLAAILRRQLPISMFLEFDDEQIGVRAYTGKTNWGVNEFIPNNTALDELGLGVIYFTDAEMPDNPEEPPEPDEPDGADSIYAYDFIANSVDTYTSPIREENDFNAAASYIYQQKIDCYACDPHCSRCGDDGLMPLTYTTEEWTFRECGACKGSGMNPSGTNFCGACKGNGYAICSRCGGDGIKANGDYCDSDRCSGGLLLVKTIVYHTDPNGQRCNNSRCRYLCRICNREGIIWYKKGMPVAAPTKTATAEIFVEGATLDYTKGTSGVMKFTKSITMTADNPMEVKAVLNAGERIGNKILVARINWNGRGKEFNRNNNEKRRTINVIPATNLTVQYLPPNAPYRTDTEIVTSFMVINKENIGALNIRPKHNLTADFKAINPNTGAVVDTSQMNSIVIPKGGSNLVYFKWYLPSSYTASSIKLECHINESQSVKEMDYSDNIAVGTVDVQIKKEQIPPDTKFENKPAGFMKPSGYEATPTDKWADSVINAASYERWEWHSSGGAIGDYVKNKYSISLEPEYSLVPDTKSPSRQQLSQKEWLMRSGYGVDIEIDLKLNSNLPSDAHTNLQSGNVYLPEFRYSSSTNKYRSLEVVDRTLRFYQNPYTITDKGEQDFKRLHFTPLWYPDGRYHVKTYIYDCWTPVGMLSKTEDLTKVSIDGSMYDDWYMAKEEKRE